MSEDWRTHSKRGSQGRSWLVDQAYRKLQNQNIYMVRMADEGVSYGTR